MRLPVWLRQVNDASGQGFEVEENRSDQFDRIEPAFRVPPLRPGHWRFGNGFTLRAADIALRTTQIARRKLA